MMNSTRRREERMMGSDATVGFSMGILHCAYILQSRIASASVWIQKVSCDAEPLIESCGPIYGCGRKILT